MKKTLIISILTGMLVIGLIPAAMANPKIDSNAQAMNEKKIHVDVNGAQAAEANVNQILTNNGNLDNHNIGLGGNAEAISVNTGIQKTGNGNKLGGCNSGDWSGVGGHGTGKATAKGTGSGANGGGDDFNGNGLGVADATGAGSGGDSNGDSGNGGNGCNSVAASDLDQDSSATAIGGEGNSGDVIQSNDIIQTASAEIYVDQELIQPVDIREFQVANAHEDSTIDFTIPVFDNEDSQIIIEKENPTIENTDKSLK
ncbi:hypothetical protein [Candidatus Methanoperedens nitratireducens]|uniref:Uncharacterized protein n=1 Tax=Candidatus Methanoperedens nitratireducens TaxID=1392998 RepID=A0A284VTS5_9EURY|nr:hypothetical protein [Candidatus Methanoperedens nitroreducens]SNQ62567.1 exported hypothetical protein [Candidatus Methanoperedens nitroreducens]